MYLMKKDIFLINGTRVSVAPCKTKVFIIKSDEEMFSSIDDGDYVRSKKGVTNYLFREGFVGNENLRVAVLTSADNLE